VRVSKKSSAAELQQNLESLKSSTPTINQQSKSKIAFPRPNLELLIKFNPDNQKGFNLNFIFYFFFWKKKKNFLGTNLASSSPPPTSTPLEIVNGFLALLPPPNLFRAIYMDVDELMRTIENLKIPQSVKPESSPPPQPVNFFKKK